MQMRRSVSYFVHVDDSREYPKGRIIFLPLPECFCQEVDMQLISSGSTDRIFHFYIGAVISELNDALLYLSELFSAILFLVN